MFGVHIHLPSKLCMNVGEVLSEEADLAVGKLVTNVDGIIEYRFLSVDILVNLIW